MLFRSDRLPSDSLLKSALDRIERWWEAAYLNSGNPVLAERFRIEARASLPIVRGESFQLDDVFSGLIIQRLRLKHNQQVPESNG